MSERPDVPRSWSPPGTAPSAPQATASTVLVEGLQAMPPAQTNEEEARARIACLEREAKAMGNEPGAALLFHEIGLIWDEVLRNPRSAAVAYQSAFKLAPTFSANIRAARRLFAEVGNWEMVVQ